MQKGRKLSYEKSGIFRITIDRYDRDADMIRLEIVPLWMGVTFKEIERVFKKENRENSSWWDYEKCWTEILSRKEIKDNLGLKDKDEIHESMVFYVHKEQGEIIQIIHATQLARALSSELYSKLLERKPTKSEKNE